MAQIQAEPDAGGYVHAPRLVCPARPLVEPDRFGEIGRRIAAAGARIAEDGGGVGKGRDAAGIGVRISHPSQGCDRAGRDQSVAVQEQHVTRAGGFDAGIGRGGKACVRGVPQQNDPPCRRQPVEPCGQRRLR